MNVSLNPMAVGNATGLFRISSEGYIQGTMLPDPAKRFALDQGVLADTEALPIYGGVAITETLSASPNNMGNTLKRAISNAAINGFVVSNQAHNFISTPSSPVPLGHPGMSAPFVRLGSGVRIVVACDEDLAAILAAGGSDPKLQVTWDYNAQRLVEYNAATASVNVTSITAAYDAATGYWTFTVVAAAASNVGAAGDAFTVAGVTATGGTASISEVNAVQIADTWTDSQHFTFRLKGDAGAFGAGALAGVITLVQATGALAVRIIAVEKGNSMIVVHNPATGDYDWNRAGSTVVIEI